MKIHCNNREGLLSACQLASAAIKPRDVKPALKNLKAVAGDGRCTLKATDMELGISLDVQSLTIEEAGEALLPAAKLIDILRESRDPELLIEADDNGCLIRGASLEFEMPGGPVAEFPDWPSFGDDKYHEVTAGTLREMIRRTVFAAADDTGRYSMSGVLWELDDGQAKLVSTDGKRLAVCEGVATATGGHTTKGQTPVVPSKAMNLLERNLQDEGEVVKISIRPNDVLFRTERAVIYSRLVEGRFPPYRDAFPKKAAVKVPLPVTAFLAAVRQAAIMTDDDSKRVTFRFDKGKLTLEAQGATAGRSKVEMPLEHDGKTLSINFNPVYLTDMLKVLPPDAALTVDLIDGGSPALFKCGQSYSYLVMPLT